MSDSRNDESVRGEIQKLLVRINEDMKELYVFKFIFIIINVFLNLNKSLKYQKLFFYIIF